MNWMSVNTVLQSALVAAVVGWWVAIAGVPSWDWSALAQPQAVVVLDDAAPTLDPVQGGTWLGRWAPNQRAAANVPVIERKQLGDRPLQSLGTQVVVARPNQLEMASRNAAFLDAQRRGSLGFTPSGKVLAPILMLLALLGRTSTWRPRFLACAVMAVATVPLAKAGLFLSVGLAVPLLAVWLLSDIVRFSLLLLWAEAVMAPIAIRTKRPKLVRAHTRLAPVPASTF